MGSFYEDIQIVLKEKDYSRQFYPLEAFAKSVEMNRKYTERKIFIYKWSGLFLLTAIPIISALLTVLVSPNNSTQKLASQYIFLISLSLTIFTILNSIFKPGERFREACRLGVGINNFIIDFLNDLEKINVNEISSLIKLIEKKKKCFELYQMKLIDLFLPVERIEHEKNIDKADK